MFNIGTILFFIIGLIICIFIKKRKKKKLIIPIYIISFVLIYVISSAAINAILMDNYLSSIENGNLIYLELENVNLDKYDKDGTEYFCEAADYAEGRYRVIYYMIDGEEIYQPIGQGLLINEIINKEEAFKTKVTLRYNNILRKFFLQFNTKTFNIISVNSENIYYLN